MKKALLRPLSFAVLVFALAQAYGQQHCFQPRGQEVLNGNNVRTVILNGGDLFWDGERWKHLCPAHAVLKGYCLNCHGGGGGGTGLCPVCANARQVHDYMKEMNDENDENDGGDGSAPGGGAGAA